MSCPLCNQQNHQYIGEKNNYKLVKCLSCDFIHVNPMPQSTILEKLYDHYSQTDNYLKKLKKKIFTSRYKLKKLRKYLKSNHLKFLDVGCSIGATVEAAHQLGFLATGIDLDKVAIKEASTLFPNNQFQTITTQDLAKNKNLYDLIYCAEVVEHVPDPHEFISSLNSLMNKGSILYLTTPDAGHRKVPKDFVSWNRVTPPEHIGYFNRQTMTKLLEEHNFQIIKYFWSHRANMRVVCRKV
ncbi:MAG: class I SAM-dependent methyltransferase [Marinicellaceae bacterium]